MNKHIEETIKAFFPDGSDAKAKHDPVEVLTEHYEANADAALKAKCVAEGKTVKEAYKFLESVARELHSKYHGNICLSDRLGCAVAMHFMQDVPMDWNAVSTKKGTAAGGTPAERADGADLKGLDSPQEASAPPAKSAGNMKSAKEAREAAKGQTFFCFD